MIDQTLTERRAAFVPVCVSLIALFFCIWASLALGHISVRAILAICAIIAAFFGTGLSFIGVVSSAAPHKTPLSIILVSGTLLSSIALYILRSVTPLGMIAALGVVLIAALLLGAYAFRKHGYSFAEIVPKSSLLEVCTIALLGLATSFWCLDLFTPFAQSAGEITLKVWPDAFYHLSQISMFAIYDKEFPLADVQFAGSELGLYHYGSYTAASLFTALSGAQPIIAYSAIYVPLALVLVYLAALGTIQEFFGAWPAFTATAVLATFPDASAYGLSNPFFGYNWLQQIAPSGAYGVACACIALYFILKGILENQIKLVAVGFFFVILTGLFKAQIFVPLGMSSVLIPTFFYGSFKPAHRLILLGLAAVTIFAATEISQRIAALPSLRLDGSALDWYRTVLLSFTPDGVLKRIFARALGDASGSFIRQFTTFGTFVFFSTLGVFGAALLASLFVRREKSSRALTFAPAIVVLIYLVLASFLALEQSKMGTPEEFLHRHFVWAYFSASIFSVAALSQRAFNAAKARAALLKPLLLALGFVSLYWPASLSSGIQSAPYLSAPYPTLSVCEMQVIEFIENSSSDTDILHDTAYNTGFRWSGLTGLRAYITDSGGYRMPTGAARALETLKGLEIASQELADHLRAGGVDWLISRRAVDGARGQVFQCGTLYVSKL